MDVLLLTVALIPPFLLGLWVRRLIERSGREYERLRLAKSEYERALRSDIHRGMTEADRQARDELAWKLGLLPYGASQWVTDTEGGVWRNPDAATRWRI